MRHLNVQTKPLHSYLCLKRDYAVLCFSKFKGINHLLKKKKTHYKWSEENNFSVIFETVIITKKNQICTQKTTNAIFITKVQIF